MLSELIVIILQGMIEVEWRIVVVWVVDCVVCVFLVFEVEVFDDG